MKLDCVGKKEIKLLAALSTVKWVVITFTGDKSSFVCNIDFVLE